MKLAKEVVAISKSQLTQTNMTNKQTREHKIGNAQRKARLFALYYKVKPTAKSWLLLGPLPQNGKHTVKTGIPVYDN